MDDIRKRKGLPTDEKVVKDATKQRTVTRSLALMRRPPLYLEHRSIDIVSKNHHYCSAVYQNQFRSCAAQTISSMAVNSSVTHPSLCDQQIPVMSSISICEVEFAPGIRPVNACLLPTLVAMPLLLVLSFACCIGATCLANTA